jgi:hypothetical protein
VIYMTGQLFHGTGIGNLTSISVQGLRADHSGQTFSFSKACIYLTTRHDTAHWWACSNPTDPVILSIDRDKIDERRVSEDTNADNPECMEYWVHRIPPDWLTVEWGDRWYPVHDRKAWPEGLRRMAGIL